MTQHTDLIERLRASSEDGLTPDDAYAAAEALEAQAREIAELKAQEAELCTLYGLAEAECKKLRAEIEGLRKDAERYAVVRRGQHWSVIDGIGDPLTGDRLDAGIDAVIAEKGQP